MAPPIQVKQRTYIHFTDMEPANGVRIEDRGFMSPSLGNVDLRKTCGAYVQVGDRNILFVIDHGSAPPGSDQWTFIRKVAGALAIRAPNLDATAKEALGHLQAVIFTQAPARSFADVAKANFIYDTDEFRRPDGSGIREEYAASNIVHDANHVRLKKLRRPYVGEAAEKECWQLQVDNCDALGLDETEVTFLKGLIANPALAQQRMDQRVG